MFNDSSAPNAMDAKQQGNKARGSVPQQKAGTSDSSDSGNGQPSPSRDQGHGPSGSSKPDAGNNRSDNSPRQTGENN